MKLYIVTMFDPSGLSDRIVKIFSSKEHLDKWLECAKLMYREIFGEPTRDITQDYRIREADLDNLDFIELLAEARSLGAFPKPSNPQ